VTPQIKAATKALAEVIHADKNIFYYIFVPNKILRLNHELKRLYAPEPILCQSDLRRRASESV